MAAPNSNLGALKDMMGSPPKQLLLHMAIGDDEVPNLATEWQARTMGIPALAPASAYTPYGMTAMAGPIVGGSALVVMDGGWKARRAGQERARGGGVSCQENQRGVKIRRRVEK